MDCIRIGLWRGKLWVLPLWTRPPQFYGAMLQRHEVMEEFTKHNIKCHPSITFIFVYFLIKANISEPLQEIFKKKREIKVLSTKSNRHYDRLTKLEK